MAIRGAEKRHRWYAALYVQVLAGIVAGVVVGWIAPQAGEALRPIGDVFLKMIKMVIGLVIFCTVVNGLGGMSDLKRVGRVGGKALIYFEVVSTLALLIGAIVANVVRPGAGFNADPARLDATAVAAYVGHAQQRGAVDFLMGMRFAPLGAFGAMAYTIGRFGMGSLKPLFGLIATFYATGALFVCAVMGAISRWAGFSIFKLMRYLKEELLITLGAASSDVALPSLMEKLTNLGCSRSVVGLVVPTGYVFNADGTSLYMTLAALFVAQAMNIELSFMQQMAIFGVAMLASKGASGITGAGFIALVATLSVVPDIPLAGMALILGIDRFMSAGRAVVNIIGNAVAAVVMASLEGELDRSRMLRVLNGVPMEDHPAGSPLGTNARCAPGEAGR